MGLRYVGRDPDFQAALVHKNYVDTRWASVRVDNTFIDNQVAPVAATLAVQSYVDAQDATKAKKTYVDSQDALYVPAIQRGAASGVAPLNASVQVPAANVPSGIVTDRVAVAAPTMTLIMTGVQTVTSTTNTKEFLAATLAFPDPGYPWVPLLSGQVVGNATGTDPTNGWGKGVYAQAIVFDSNNNVWARTVTTSNYHSAAFPLQPWAVSGQASMTITGPMTLSLYLSLFSRASGVTENYQFTPTGMIFTGVAMGGL